MEEAEEAWDLILKRIVEVLDWMCPLRNFKVKNYRPDLISNELLEQIKDQDYFYNKAKNGGNEDAWNIAKFLRNAVNSNVRQAKREFVLNELKENENNCKKFWKVIKKVIPSKKGATNQDILLKKDRNKLHKEEVADFINDYFINVGNQRLGDEVVSVNSKGDSQKQNKSIDPPPTRPELEDQLNELTALKEVEVFRVIKDINTSKSSGIKKVSSFALKQAFFFFIPEITHMLNLSLKTSTFPD